MRDLSIPALGSLENHHTHDSHVVVAQVICDGFCDAGLLSNTQYCRLGSRWHDMLMLGNYSILSDENINSEVSLLHDENRKHGWTRRG